MSRLPILTTVTLAALGAAALGGGAIAQVPGQAPGPRYLSWNARPAPAVLAPAEVQPALRPDAAMASAAPVRRPNRVIPHGGMAFATPPAHGLTPAPGGTPGRLTPASAWLRPSPVPEAPIAEPAAPPPVREMARAEPAPVYAPPPTNALPPPPAPRNLPEFVPDRGRQPAPAAMVEPPRPAPAPVPASAPDYDPMAPRRDAPIFRIQQAPPASAQDAPAAAEAGNEPTHIATVARNAADRPAQQGARYYSVHRQNGQQPDAMVMPEPTYVDALTLTMTETPASRDLAEPDQGPTLIRDNQGRMRAAPAASDGDHQ